MTKRLKIFLIALLSAFLTISASVLLFPAYTQAAEAETDTDTTVYPTYKGHTTHDKVGADFKWQSGASTLPDDYYVEGAESVSGLEDVNSEEISYGLKFNLEITDLTHENIEDGFHYKGKYQNAGLFGGLLLDYDGIIDSTPQYGLHATDYSMYHKYSFTVHRVNNADSATALTEITYLFYYVNRASGEKDLVCSVLERNISEYQELIHAPLPERESDKGYTVSNKEWYWFDSSQVCNSDVRALLLNDDYAFVGTYLSPSGLPFVKTAQANGNVAKILPVYVFPNSPFVDYFVEFKHEYFFASTADLFSYYFVKCAESIDTDSRSVYGIWQAMQNATTLEDIYSEDTINNVITPVFAQANKQLVTINYLEDIKGTPFAHKVTKTVEVPVMSGAINVADVYTSLEVDLLPVADTSVYLFEQEGETTTYNALYLKNVWLRSITVDGKYYDYFLDVNLSYEDYYKPFVDAEILPSGAYETMFNHLIGKYPNLTGYKFDEVYGYFGFVFTPQNLSYNSLFKEVFDVETSQSGMTEQYSYDCILSQDAYNKLLNDYKYSWHQILFSHASNIVTGSVNATAYMFYSVPGTKLAHIGEGGQSGSSDTDGIIGGAIKDVGNWASDVLGGVWNVVAEPLRNEGTIRTVLIVAIVGVGVYLAFKYGLISIGGGKKRK